METEPWPWAVSSEAGLSDGVKALPIAAGGGTIWAATGVATAALRPPTSSQVIGEPHRTRKVLRHEGLSWSRCGLMSRLQRRHRLLDRLEQVVEIAGDQAGKAFAHLALV